MPTLTITIDGKEYSYGATPEQAAGLDATRERVMAELPGDPDTPIEERDGYLDTNEEYLQSVVAAWFAQNPDATPDDIQLCIGRSLNSWSEVPGPLPEPTPATPEQLKERLVAYAIDKRWRVEVGGFLWEPAPGIIVQVPTDDRAKLLILGASMTLSDDATSPFIISGHNMGLFTGLQFKALNQAVVSHVRDTFPVLADVLDGIESEEITTTAEIEAADWPG
jgi:hypothetical protein